MPLCRGCGKPIKFDSSMKSQAGKFIPLDMDGEKHQCPANPYNANRHVSTAPPSETTPTTSTTQPAATGGARPETVWMIPKEDWDGLKQAMQYIGDNQNNIQKQIDQLTQYYSTLVEMLNNNKNNDKPPKWEQNLIDREERFDRDREQGIEE